MAATDSDLINNLALYAALQSETTGGAASAILKAMYLAAGPALATGGGRLISASVNGKAFAYQVDPRLSASDLMTAIRGALALVNLYTPAQLAAILATPRTSVGYVGFC